MSIDDLRTKLLEVNLQLKTTINPVEKEIFENEKNELQWQISILELHQENPDFGRDRILKALQQDFPKLKLTMDSVRNFMSQQGIQGKSGRPKRSNVIDAGYIQEILGEDLELVPFLDSSDFELLHTIPLGFLYPYEPEEGSAPLRYQMSLVFLGTEFPVDHIFDQKLVGMAQNKQRKRIHILYDTENVRNCIVLLVLHPCFWKALERNPENLSLYWIDQFESELFTTMPVPYIGKDIVHNEYGFWDASKGLDLDKIRNQVDIINTDAELLPKTHPLHASQLKNTLEKHPELFFFVRNKVINIADQIDDITSYDELNFDWELDVNQLYFEHVVYNSYHRQVSIPNDWLQYYNEYRCYKFQKQGKGSQKDNKRHIENILAHYSNYAVTEKGKKPSEGYHTKINNLKEKKGIMTKAIPLTTYFPFSNKAQLLYKMGLSTQLPDIVEFIDVHLKIREKIYPNYTSPIRTHSCSFIIGENDDDWGFAWARYQLKSEEDAMLFFVRGGDVFWEGDSGPFVNIYAQTPIWDDIDEEERIELVTQYITEKTPEELFRKMNIVPHADGKLVWYSSLLLAEDCFKTEGIDEVKARR